MTCLSDLDSAFQLQEHLASLITSITNPAGSNRTFPLSRADCQRLATPPDGVEETLWCYELTRRLTRDLNVLIVALLNDKCTASTCPEMRASEWQYLCAVHESPQSCCAIDYSTHTLDQAATMLTSTKYFPSRLSLHQASVKHLASIFRRLYRIFAHAWFQHRHVFWEVEGEHGLYLFFKTVSDRYRLIPQDNLMLPPEAEGLKSDKNGIQGEREEDEDEDEDDIDEWDRGTQPRAHPEGPEEEEDEEEEENYSDESESDEEIVGGEDEDVDIIDDDDVQVGAKGKETEVKIEKDGGSDFTEEVSQLSEETKPPGDAKVEPEEEKSEVVEPVVGEKVEKDAATDPEGGEGTNDNDINKNAEDIQGGPAEDIQGSTTEDVVEEESDETMSKDEVNSKVTEAKDDE